MTRALYARVEGSVHERLTAVAHRTGLPMATIVNELLRQGLGLAPGPSAAEAIRHAIIAEAGQ